LHVYITSLNQSAFLMEYPKFWELMESYKLLYKWNVTEILSREKAPERPKHIDDWFVVKDAAVNAVYASGWAVLADLARELGDTETADYCDDEYKISRDAIVNKMWQPNLNRFQTLYIDNDGIEKVSVANTIQNLFPILLHDLPQNQLDVIVSQAGDEKKFLAPYSLTTVAQDDPQFWPTFEVDLMWRGPVWGFTNWFVLEGLGLHKQNELQEKILLRWVDLVQHSGIWEHYNPYTGEQYGPEGLGMSTLICDWIYRYGWA